MKSKFALSIIVAMSPCLANASAIFSDNFDANAPALNTAPTGWSIGLIPANGTVDIVANNTYGITCFSSSAACIDLDGSTNRSGQLISPDLNLTAGVTYAASFELSGNQRLPQTEKVDVLFGTTLQQFTFSQNDPFALETLTFTPTISGTYHLRFLDQSKDNYGAILDNVSVQAVPEPATYALMFLGLGLVATVSRRKRRDTALTPALSV